VSSTSTAKAGRLPFPRLFGFSFGSIPAYMLLAMTGVYIPPFYAGKMGVSLTVLGATIGIIRLTDLGLDLMLGWLMDKTKTPLGRYRPWYVAGLPVLWLATYKVFNPPVDVGTTYLFVWYIALYIAYSMIVLAHSAWAASISHDYHDRSRMFGWMLGLAVVGSSLLQGLPLLTHGRIRPADPASIPTIGWIIMIASGFCVLITVLSAPERRSPVAANTRPSFKDYAAVFTNPSMFRLIAADLFLVLGPGASAPIYLFFFHDAKGFDLGTVSVMLIPYTAAGIVGAPFWARIAQKIGKHRTVQLCGIGYAITQTVLMAIPAKLFWPTFASMFTVGFCLAGFVVLIRAMVADVADQLRLETGQERSGVLYALVTLTQKLGSSLAVTITYPILDMVGYVAKPGYKNTPAAIHGLSMTYVFAPIILVVIGSACLIGYKLDAKRQSEIRAALDELAAKDYAASLEGLAGPGENVAAPAS
jgi:glycoside/pentoside/hexuronide:cation symporter, GPH family